MSESQSSYRQIFKATSLFGGVQVINIITQIIKQKFIAVLLGPTGMGISGLFLSVIQLIQGFTAMGLSSSAVKNVAQAIEGGDMVYVSRTVTVLRKLVWFTGLLGMVVTIIFSPYLSYITFGNYDYTLSFIFLSVILLFQQFSAGQNVVLQGMRKLKYLAKAGVMGSVAGLFISVPIYYYFRIEGIVPTLILSAAASLIFTWYFSRKIQILNTEISPAETFAEGKEMLKMGIVMSLNNVLVLGVAYIVRVYIGRTGGTDEVGLYTAGFAIVSSYVGLIFTAMGTDYYPRLASVSNDREKSTKMVNQQAEIAVLILTPILIVFLIFAPLLITILYSNKFIGVTAFMQWAVFGMLFKAVSWSIAYQFIARGDSKVFALNETFSNVIFLGLSICFYRLFGLTGLGIAFFTFYLLYMLQVFFVAKGRYKFSFLKDCLMVFFIQMTMLTMVFSILTLWKSPFAFIAAVILGLLSASISYKELDKRMNIGDILKKFKKKIRR